MLDTVLKAAPNGSTCGERGRDPDNVASVVCSHTAGSEREAQGLRVGTKLLDRAEAT